MKIISWNVNGIRAVHRKELFVPFIQEHQPDILLLQETKAEKHQSEIDLKDYTEYWNSAEKKGYSGTAIFSKTTPLSVINGIPEKISSKYGLNIDKFGDLTTEGRVIAAEFPDFYVVSVYTPNAKEDLGRLELRHKRWDPAFLEYMKELEATKPVIFGGDLNVAHTPDDLANPRQNEGKKGYTAEEREGIDNIIDAGFIDSFRMFTQDNGHYTWWSHFANSRARNVGWRIDYFFVSPVLKDRIVNAEILDKVMGSDHCPVSVILK
jgi:exodeoxyribonuclease-3